MVYLGPKLCVTGIRLAGHLERQEPAVLMRELSAHLDAGHNAQKKGENETAIKNIDESVNKPDEDIKDVNKRTVFNVSDPRAKT